MTRVLFLPNDHNFIILKTDLTADDLMADIDIGNWSPPEPYNSQYSAELKGGQWKGYFQGVQVGRLVIIVSRKPLFRKSTESMPLPNYKIDMSPRQTEVLQALANGMSTKQIAHELGVSERTIAQHIADVKQRLGTYTLAETMAQATVLGICAPEAHEPYIQGVLP